MAIPGYFLEYACVRLVRLVCNKNKKKKKKKMIYFTDILYYEISLQFNSDFEEKKLKKKIYSCNKLTTQKNATILKFGASDINE